MQGQGSVVTTRADSALSVPSSSIVSSPTETMETYVFKLALEWRVHLNHVIVIHNDFLSPKYVNLLELVRPLLDPETSIEAVVDHLNRRTGRKWDAIVATVLIFLLAEKLNVTNLTQLGKTSAADVTNTLLFRLNEFARRRNITLYDLASAEHARASYVKERDASLRSVREKVKLLAETQERYVQAMESDVLRLSQLDVFNEVLHFIVAGDLTREDTLTVFDNARISNILQHVVCFSGVIYQKVYKPGPFDPPVRRSAINTNLTSHPPLGVLLFTISLSQVYHVQYTIESGVMETSVRMRDKQALIEAIAVSFPSLKFQVRVQQLETRLNLYPTKELAFDIPFYYLLHRTIVQPYLFQFYVNESTTTSPEKSLHTFRHRPYWQVQGMKGDRDESTFTLTTPRMANGTNYINLTIISPSESACIRALTLIIPALCICYMEDILNVSPFHRIYNIPGLVAKSYNPASKLRKELAEKWPEVFTPNYLAAKETSTKSLVRVTTEEDEADRWREEIIFHDQGSYEREVFAFPPEAEEGLAEVMFWFTSSSPEARRLGYRTNDYDDSPKYPLVPFSSAKGVVQRIKGLSGGNVVSLAVQDEGFYAEAPDVVSHILGFQARRRGVAIGPNSVIRALMDAVSEVGGLGGTLDEDVEAVRSLLATRFEPEIYKQQLYDLTNEDIMQKLDERGDYFDPLIYSAGLEEIFGIDIYYIKARIVQNVRIVTMELPRHSYFYCANRARRNCVVILINSGVRSDRLRWPHCEMIVPKGNNSPLYGPKISARLAEIRERCHKFLVCIRGNVFNGNYMESAMNQVLKSFSKVVSQYVDPNGKARAFTVQDEANDLVTIFCYPCAPLSLPHSSVVHITLDASWLETFCKSTSLGRSESGVWCKDQVTSEVLYVRVATLPDIPMIGMDPLTSVSGIEESSRFASEISARNRLALVLKEVMIWALDVSGLSARKFIRKHLTYTLDETDQDSYYDIDSIGRRLPPVKSMNEAFAYLEHAIPNQDGRFILHNEAYYKSMTYVLSGHAMIEYDPRTGRFIKDFYASAGDFRADKRAIILTGQVDPLATAVDTLSKYMIVDHIGTIGRLPIFYAQGETLWIVQATHFKEVKCAYTVCEQWRTKKINSGYHSLPTKNVRVSILLYRVSVGKIIPDKLIQGHPDDAEISPYEILQLGDNNFAALLRASEPIN